MEYGVHSVLRTLLYYCYFVLTSSSTALPPPEVSGLEKRATSLHKVEKKKKKKKRSSFLVNCLMCFNPWIIYLFRCTSDIARVTCLLDPILLLPEDSPQEKKKLSCTDARKVLLPHHVPPPLYLSCTDIPKGGSYSALCYHSCQRVNRSSCRNRK